MTDEPYLRESSDFAAEQVAAICRTLTPVQRTFVKDACLHGDVYMTTVRALKRKGLFHLVISSPNGQCGFMRLTPFGEAVRSALLGNG